MSMTETETTTATTKVKGAAAGKKQVLDLLQTAADALQDAEENIGEMKATRFNAGINDGYQAILDAQEALKSALESGWWS